ncbi:probable G-protein coupled receptor 21 [Haliotis asinina]|uniref:probable G-protein coupled receptor 21 n=1 Tax=Haliotis asinina TaxID=109174 RepID=UPI0035319301
MSEAVFTFETFVTIFLTLAIICLNCLILMVACWTESFRNVNKCFLYSLILSDLFLGLFVTPFAIFNSLYKEWVFQNDIFCCIEAYLVAIFLIAGLYSMAWINVDHYVAVRKPERYDIMMSTPRSLCWIGFAWVAAFCFSCPPLFSLKKAKYYAETFVCIVDAKNQQAYFITAGLLVTGPAVITLIVTNAYLFTKAFKGNIHLYERVFRDRKTRPWNYHINFVISLVYSFCWLPFCILRLYEVSTNYAGLSPGLLHFYFLWLGFSNAFLKFFIYLVMSQEFRQGINEIFYAHSLDCACVGCKTSNDMNVNFITIAEK